MSRDKIFSEKNKVILDFSFDKDTAEVFDDMLSRSVPFYDEVQRMICEIAVDFAVSGTNIYDLGCSTCTTFLYLDSYIDNGVNFIGIDSSQEMLNKGREKLIENNINRKYELLCKDLNKEVNITNASVIIMNLTLQFIRPLYREKVMNNIFSGLREEGCLILVEKVISEHSLLNRLFIKYYYEMKKRRGYSELEIAQKREALENVLIPYKLEENRDLILKSGFRYFDTFFKWYNFCGMLAVK